MTKHPFLTFTAAAFMLAGAGSLSVVAAQQTGGSGQPAAPAGQPPAAGQGWHHDHMVHMCRDMDAHLAAMLAYDEVKLGITEAQRPAWKKLTDTLHSAQEPVRRVCAELAQQPPATTLPARLDRIQKMAEAKVAAMRTALPAIEQFYGTLSPDQKKIADEMVEHGGMMHGHEGMGGHM